MSRMLKSTRTDGSLYNCGDYYVKWDVNEDKQIEVDGRFTAEELMWLASHVCFIQAERKRREQEAKESEEG